MLIDGGVQPARIQPIRSWHVTHDAYFLLLVHQKCSRDVYTPKIGPCRVLRSPEEYVCASLLAGGCSGTWSKAIHTPTPIHKCSLTIRLSRQLLT